MRHHRIVLIAACLAPSLAQAQPPETRRVEIRRIGVGEPGGNLNFTWATEAFEGKPVKNAPYTATAVTEVEQTLGDGNRIRQKTTSQLARDREGRSRRALTLGAVGPLAVGGDTPKMTFLQDPVSGDSYILDSEHKIARRMPRATEITAGGGDGKATRIEEGKPVRIEDDHVFQVAVPPPGGGMMRRMGNPRTEDLGSQLIEGVRAQGTRSTITIPAGEIGNERPLVTVSERWFSPDLGVVVMSKHSDPRMGTTTYKLTDVRRGDPDPALFQVPADYSMKDDPGRRMILRKRTTP